MRKVETSVRSPAGLEWTIFRNLPRIALLSLVVLVILRALLGIALTFSHRPNLSKDLGTLDYSLVGIGVTLALMLIFTAFFCATILIAKGPQYTADSYEVDDTEFPTGRRTDERGLVVDAMTTEGADAPPCTTRNAGGVSSEL